jgi:hypothetical protein
MKSIKVVFWILIFMAVGRGQDAGTGIKNDITLHTSVENENVPLNREVVYHIDLQWPGDLSQYKISEIGEPQVTNLIMRGSGSSNRVSTDLNGNPVSVKRVTYYFKPLEMGMAYVEGIVIRYEDAVQLRQESLISGRIGIKIIEPLPEPGDHRLGTAAGLLLVSTVVICAAVYFFYRYRRRVREEAVRAAQQVQESVEVRYLRILKETIHFTSTNFKDSLADLSRLLTGYFSERYNFPAMNLSTENLLQVLRSKMSDDLFRRAADFYNRADMVKFAGEMISESEFHSLFDTVELILEKQKELRPTGKEEE